MPGLDQQLRVTLFLCSGLCNKTHQTGRLINNRKLSHHSGVWKSESRTPAFSAEGRPPGSQPAPPPCPPQGGRGRSALVSLTGAPSPSTEAPPS